MHRLQGMEEGEQVVGVGAAEAVEIDIGQGRIQVLTARRDAFGNGAMEVIRRSFAVEEYTSKDNAAWSGTYERYLALR